MKVSNIMAVCAIALVLAACGQAMDNQPKYETYEPASPDLFPDRQSARPRVPNTIAHSQDLKPRPKHMPYKVTMKLLKRGRDQFNVFCAPCHSRLGDGNGIVVKRGFPHPPSYHSERLRAAPLVHFYDVITDGYGIMYSYADRVTPKDRWAIAAYIRALQLSQHAPQKDVPKDVTLAGKSNG
ncbi:MAG TPA: cytochrome c [Gammaproteobacteria bacterium]|nr:cytochrome c [Gammaproteobacteria bacterium]